MARRTWNSESSIRLSLIARPREKATFALSTIRQRHIVHRREFRDSSHDLYVRAVEHHIVAPEKCH
jgi:hypothetical protein